jgi:hypothetical protein
MSARSISSRKSPASRRWGLVERLVGSLAFAVVHHRGGSAGVWGLTLHPVSVQAGAAGAIFGIYGLPLATLVGVVQRSTHCAVHVLGPLAWRRGVHRIQHSH